jgi:Tfp pilus assembly protein PilF
MVLSLLAAGCAGGRSGGDGYATYDKNRHAGAIIELGVVALNTGNYAKALAALAEAEKLDPQNPVVKQYTGRTYFRLREYEKARANYEEALRLNPRLTDVHNDLGLLFMETKDYARARDEFNICLSDLAYLNSTLARYNLALVEEAEGNRDAARTIYQAIIASGEDNAAPYFRLAFMAYQDGNFTHAADLLNTAVRVDPNYAEAFFLLGDTYEKLGLKDEAAHAYGQAVVLDPKSLRGIEAQRRVREIMKDYRN